MDYQPCQNPSCKSFGKSHPNCKCYAEGGSVCSGPHADSCEHYADGGDVKANLEFQNNPDLAIDHAVAHHGLHHLLTKTGHTKEGYEHREFLNSARHGRKAIGTHSDSMLDPKAMPIKSDDDKVKNLEARINELQSNPEAAFDLGGSLGDNLPIHHAALAAKAATAMSYLGGIKPTPTASAPLDKAMPIGRTQEKDYQRQLAIAENPTLIYQYAKDGMLRPADLQTLSAIYPKLQSSIQDRAFETMTDAVQKGRELTQSQKKKMGLLVGQHLTYQQSPAAIQAIMHANAPQLPAPPPQKQKKASGVELKQINQVNKLSETPLQKLQSGK